MRSFSTLLLFAIIATPSVFAAKAYHNQVGFLPEASKKLVLEAGTASNVVFKDSNGTEKLSVKPSAIAFWEPAQDSVRLVDFSSLKTPGTYQAYQDKALISHPIIIQAKAWEAVTKASLKFFYFQRSSTALLKENAGIYARAAGHLDTAVQYHSELGKTTGKTFNGAKGWYDAGDYGKYIVNSGITTYTLLKLYEYNKAYFDSLRWNLPESDNATPDILDEIKWNLDWMLTMQDEDGGVFHKLTTKNFSGMVMPEKDKAIRYAIGKTTTATLNFAAVMALAGVVFWEIDNDYAKECVFAASKAFNWAKINPTEYYTQPSDVGTGTYGDSRASDERQWAAVELLRATGDSSSYWTDASTTPIASVPGWSYVAGLATYSIATAPHLFGTIATDAKTALLELADKLKNEADTSAYGISMTSSNFYWGSNSVAANQGMLLLHAYYVSGDTSYLTSAIQLADYLLGRNPLDLSYLTGSGVNSPKFPHHRPSAADNIADPIPGMLVGGPHSSGQDIASCQNVDYTVPNAPAKSFYDNVCSYATNEVAINWNAPFAYLIGSIQALSQNIPVWENLSLPTAPKIGKKKDPHFKRVLRNNRVRIEKTTSQGEVIYFDLQGNRE